MEILKLICEIIGTLIGGMVLYLLPKSKSGLIKD